MATRDPWWHGPRSEFVTDMARAGPFIVALAGLIEVLRSGVRDPQWVLDGTTTPKAAARVALEWVEAGVEPTEVAGWLRAGCTEPRWARKMERVGITPAHLVGADGRPLHVIDEGPDMEGMPLAQAVAEEYVTLGWAVKHVAGRAAKTE